MPDAKAPTMAPEVLIADMTELKVTLARVDERMAAFQRDAEARERVADARHAENRSTLALYMTRAEIEAMNRVVGERVTALEAFKTTLVRYALALAGCVMAGLALLGKLAVAGLPPLPP